MSISKQTARKIGLWTAIAVFLNSLIGIGIFFKNNTVFQNNFNNPYGVLISWILASVISLTTAFSFAEIGFNHRPGAGLSGSTERMYGHGFGRFISINNSFFYFGILNLSLAIFCAEALVKLFYPSGIPSQFNMGYVMLIALALIFAFAFFNYISVKWSSRFQVSVMFIKFIPLISVGLLGIIFGIINSNNNLFAPSGNQTAGGITVGGISIDGIMASIPSILFAYDSFTGVGSLKGDLRNPRRNVPITIVLGMIICISFYLFVTIGQIMVGQGTAQNVFEEIFKNNANLKNAFTIIISIFIFIASVGTLNALVLVALRVNTYSIRHRIMAGYWFFQKHLDNDNKSGFLYSLIIYSFWWVLLMIPSAIINSDVLVDGVSNFPTLFMFAVYGTLVLKAWLNRFTKKIHTDKQPAFLFIAPISFLGCYIAFGYQFFYYYSVKVFIDVTNNTLNTINWGLFVGNITIHPFYAFITFFFMLIMFIIIPFANDGIIKLKYKQKTSHKILFNELLV